MAKNKFPTLKDTFQTVLIETDNCEDHIATYTEEHMKSLIRFSIKHWLDLQKNEEFTSVILYKNHIHSQVEVCIMHTCRLLE